MNTDWRSIFESCLRAGYTITKAAKRAGRSRARAYQVWTSHPEWGEKFDMAYKDGTPLRTSLRCRDSALERRRLQMRKLSYGAAMEEARKEVVDDEMEWLLREYDVAQGRITVALKSVGMAADTLYRRLKKYPDWAEKFAAAGYAPRRKRKKGKR